MIGNVEFITMSFASLIFIFIFLPAVLILFYILPRGNWRRAVLVVCSLAFFAWADLRHLPLLVGFVLLNFILGLLIGRFQAQKKAGWAKAALWVGLGVNLLFLLLYKLPFRCAPGGQAAAEKLLEIQRLCVDVSQADPGADPAV